MGSGGGKNPLNPFEQKKESSAQPVILQTPQARGPVYEFKGSPSQASGQTPDRYTTQQQPSVYDRNADLRRQADDVTYRTLQADQARTKTLGVEYQAPERGSAEYNAAVEKEFQRMVQLDAGKDPGSFRDPRRQKINQAGRTIDSGSLLDDKAKTKKKSLLGE